MKEESRKYEKTDIRTTNWKRSYPYDGMILELEHPSGH